MIVIGWHGHLNSTAQSSIKLTIDWFIWIIEWLNSLDFVILA